MKLGMGFVNLQDDRNAIASGGPLVPWPTSTWQLRTLRPVRGSNVQPPDPEIPGTLPTGGPTGG